MTEPRAPGAAACSMRRIGVVTMVARFRDRRPYPRNFRDFSDDILIHCPRCDERASVVALATQPAITRFTPRRLICPHCGLTRDWQGTGISLSHDRDWYFGFPLWLQTPCCGQTLYALNLAHVAFLESYVRASLRERQPNVNSSLASRLPRWIKSAKHRKEVLNCLTQLRALV